MARKYTRDNRGRFASGGGGATARGGRLKTASGNKRATQTMQAKGGKAGTVGKPKGLKPQDSGKLKKGIAYNRLAGINAKMGNRPDLAQVNIKGRFSGQAGKRFDAGLARAVKETKAAQLASLNLKSGKQVRSEQSRAKKLRGVHEKAVVSKYAAKMGKPATEVRSAIRGMTASQQIKFFRQYVKENRAAAAKPAAKPASRKVDEAKALRIAGRLSSLDARTKGRSSADRIRSLNTGSVRVRAVSFLRGKAKPGQETPASVAKRLNTRPRYSTGTENRNKPGAYSDLGQTKMRAQRAERMKSKFDNESIQRRISRVNQRSRARGGIDTQATAKAREVYQSQLSGRTQRGRGAQLPPRVAGEAAATKRANMLKRAKAGKPLGGASTQIRSGVKQSVISSAAAATGATRRAAARKAKRVKANAFQRSEAAYAKRRFGVHSTIKSPGRRSLNLPKQTSASGARMAVSGRTPKQAAAAQASRRNRFLDANRVKTQGTFKRSVNRQPNLLTGRVDRVGAGKFRPVAKRRR